MRAPREIPSLPEQHQKWWIRLGALSSFGRFVVELIRGLGG